MPRSLQKYFFKNSNRGRWDEVPAQAFLSAGTFFETIFWYNFANFSYNLSQYLFKYLEDYIKITLPDLLEQLP